MKKFLVLSSIFIFTNLFSQIEYIPVNKILYKDNNKNYYFQYSFMGRKYVNGEEVSQTVIAYDSLIFFRNKIVPLKKVLTPEKFDKLDNSYYSDGNYVYVENSFTTSPKFNILEINIKKIKFLGDYMKDDKCVYHLFKKLKNVNASKFKIINLDKSYEFGYDGNHVYYEGDLIKLSNLNNIPVPENIQKEIEKNYLKKRTLKKK